MNYFTGNSVPCIKRMRSFFVMAQGKHYVIELSKKSNIHKYSRV